MLRALLPGPIPCHFIYGLGWELVEWPRVYGFDSRRNVLPT